jgi:hypothetical protein
MKRDGYEADKNDIIVRFKGMDINLTANWDGTVDNIFGVMMERKLFYCSC